MEANYSLLSIETMYIIQAAHWTILYIPSFTVHLMLTILLIRYWNQYANAFYVYVLYLEFIDIAQLLLLMFNSFRHVFYSILPYGKLHTLNYVQLTIWATVVVSISLPQCAMMITRYFGVARPHIHVNHTIHQAVKICIAMFVFSILRILPLWLPCCRLMTIERQNSGPFNWAELVPRAKWIHLFQTILAALTSIFFMACFILSVYTIHLMRKRFKTIAHSISDHVAMKHVKRERRLFMMSFVPALCQLLYFTIWIFVWKLGSERLPQRHIRSQIHITAMIMVAAYNPMIYLAFNKTLRKHFVRVYFQPLLWKSCIESRVERNCDRSESNVEKTPMV